MLGARPGFPDSERTAEASRGIEANLRRPRRAPAPIGVNFEWNSRPEGTSDNSPAQNAGFSTRGKRWSPKCFFCLASCRDARFHVPLAIQTTQYRAYLRHAYVFLRSLPRQWNCRATIVRPYGTKIQDLMLTPMPQPISKDFYYSAGFPTSWTRKSETRLYI